MSVKIPPKDWGKDHWSTLLYLETRVVDHGGLIMRNDPHMRGHREGDGEVYPTRLRDGVEVFGHDDFDCVQDMVAAGLVKAPGGSRYVLTDLGWTAAGLLRRHKAEEKGIATFRWSQVESAVLVGS